MRSTTARTNGSVAFKHQVVFVAVALTLSGIAPQVLSQDNDNERSDRSYDPHDDHSLRMSESRDTRQGRRHDPAATTVEASSLDGSGNNLERPQQGAAGATYLRLAPARYGDGIGTFADGPEPRYVSNRVFEDQAQNLFSENGVTQWAYNWGQFIDHSIGLRESGDELIAIRFDADDPLEYFSNYDDMLRMHRSAVSNGSGATSPREQINTVSSYIDAAAVYGNDEARLEWLREGPVDDDMTNNSAKLILTSDGYLPRAIERDDPANAPIMDIQGELLFAPDVSQRMVVAGDKRANENIALTAVQTLFAREHNRIVDQLPTNWSEQRKFDTARQLVIAIQQYITYEEFLPVLGVHLPRTKGYRPDIDASVSNEFATVGYRAHSMIHGEIEVAAHTSDYDETALQEFRSLGIEVEIDGDEVEIAVPLNIAFNRPQLVPALGLGPLLLSLGGEPQYRNDEQIDNQLRSVLFQIPREGLEDPDACLDGPTLSDCYALVNDIGVLDIMRGRDHGMPHYNELRAAYDLPQIDSFTALTGEASEAFPVDDPLIDNTAPLDDPDTLRYVELRDANGELLELGSEAADSEAVSGVRASTLAARLKGIYGEINSVDAFVGMISEPHLSGSDLGELQHAMWTQQFQALRDGDRFFYKWNRALRPYDRPRGRNALTYRRTLADLIVDNTTLTANDVRRDMFLVAD